MKTHLQVGLILNKRHAFSIYQKSVAGMVLALLFALFVSPALGHPHVFVAQQVGVVFDDKGLAGIRIHWQFDDMFSVMIATDHDKNKNGTLEPSEVATIKQNAFSNIAESGYFTFVTIDGRPFDVKYVSDFSATLSDKKLEYRFFIPCHVTGISSFKKIKLASYDPSYYSAIYFAEKQPVTLIKADRYDVKTSLKEDPDTLIYYDMIHPWTLFLEFRVKP